MKIYLSRGECLRFPTPVNEMREGIARLNAGQVSIRDTDSSARNLARYIQCADLSSEEDIQKLNSIAERTDAMTEAEQKVFSGALDAESINGLDDVLRIVGHLLQYELIPEVTSDRQLGGWLVENNKLDVQFPKAVRPYLDYAGIGAEYYANHGGAYTPNGYVKRRDGPMELAEESSVIRLTLANERGTVILGLPASDETLERVEGMIGEPIESPVRKIRFADDMLELEKLIPAEGIAFDDANELAFALEDIEQCGELKKFYAALAAEQPGTFFDALGIALDLDDYELVPDDMDEYGRQVLERRGADLDLIEFIEGYIDFEELGNDSLYEEGVRLTDYGLIRRERNPFPPQDMGMRFV